ncbi:tyrosinase [Dendryphion nanum]|uniref:tyrosinase n=1 Tax=Dendryphion nanum TaxID=256645 RepID=A0A9P9IM25_9PLEO|nr:tyrosinase [Dendryphion nanum]
MWLTRILFSVLSATLAGSIFLKPGDTSPLRKLDCNITIVSGLPSPFESAHVPVRREIRDLNKNFPDQWNVYILGLRSFFDMNQSFSTSFYEIAGIHGRPYKIWQGAEGIPGKVINGYCPHQNTLFFGWHRPYLVLFEQELYNHVQAAALRFPPHLRDRYIAAADSFRIPYWDWALGIAGGNLPDFFVSPTLQVIGTDGYDKNISNPLHNYNFNPLIPGDFDICENEHYYEMADDYFHDTVSKGFGTAKSLNEFSLNFIEATHGHVHYVIGGANEGTTKHEGHMWPVEYSAFEPLFMLVHCNVDRLFALWQAVHPDLWVEPANINGRGNFVLEDNTWVDGNTELKPFWKTKNTFWTSNDARNTIDLGYVYPETQEWNYETEDEYRSAVNTSIATLYSSSARAMLTANAGAQGSPLNHIIEDDRFLDWSIDIEATQSFSSSFIVRFSLLDELSSEAATPVGSWSVLMPEQSHDKARLPRRASPNESRFHGTLDLTPVILDQIAAQKLGSLDPIDVVAFLKQALTWEIYSEDAKQAALRFSNDLKVTIVSSSVRIPKDPDLPMEYSGLYTEHPEATRDRYVRGN